MWLFPVFGLIRINEPSSAALRFPC